MEPLLSVDRFISLGSFFLMMGVFQGIAHAILDRRREPEKPPRFHPWVFASFASLGVGLLVPSLLVSHGVI